MVSATTPPAVKKMPAPTPIFMSEKDLGDHPSPSSSNILASSPLPPPGQEPPSALWKRETPPHMTTRTGYKDSRLRSALGVMGSRMASPPSPHLIERPIPSKLESRSPAAFDQYPSRTTISRYNGGSGAASSVFRGGNNQRNPLRSNITTISQGKGGAEQTSRVVAWVRAGQRAAFPSLPLSSSSSMSARLKTNNTTPPYHSQNIPLVHHTSTSQGQPPLVTLSSARTLANKPMSNHTGSISITPASTESPPSVFSREPVVIDLTLDDTLESPDADIQTPASSPIRSRTSSPQTSISTTETPPRTGDASGEDGNKPDDDLSTHAAKTESKSTLQPPKKRTRASTRMPASVERLRQELSLPTPSSSQPPPPSVKRQKKKRQSASTHMGRSRSSTQELSESSSSSTKDPLEQEQGQEQELGNTKVKLREGVFTGRCDDTIENNNNDNCEACSGVGRFVCCESCPKAFHFSCCQPPLDPENLPDEWFCTECHVKSNPPKPSPPGIFKGLLDSINRGEPKAFELPQEVRSYFRGVETNSAGGYVDAMEFKPLDSTLTTSTTTQSVWEIALELRTKQGDEIRLCYHCGKSALGSRRWMISCEHCPLHWHLDCLNPPLTSPPSSTRKWMCPNHAHHVQPQCRKRRNENPIEVLDSYVPNDGDIEVVDENGDGEDSFTSWNPGDVPEYRVSETDIRIDFIAACRRFQKVSQADFRPQPPPTTTLQSIAKEGQERTDALDMLTLAVAIAESYSNKGFSLTN